jgi:hypothetical protein
LTSKDPHELERARRRGRRVGLVAFSLFVGGLTAIFSVQILRQVWAPPSAETPLDCRPGIEKLFAAVRRARQAATQATGGEREALRRFRTALEPEWSFRPALGDRCASNAESARALVVLDKLRYAEEHAIRYEATSLSELRRRASEIEHP